MTEVIRHTQPLNDVQEGCCYRSSNSYIDAKIRWWQNAGYKNILGLVNVALSSLVAHAGVQCDFS